MLEMLLSLDEEIANIETLISTEWDEQLSTPRKGEDYEVHLLARLKLDLLHVPEVPRVSDIIQLVRWWEFQSVVKEYNRNWQNEFNGTRYCSVKLLNRELAQIAQYLFWRRMRPELGYLAEAIFYKYVSSLSRKHVGHFHRLPSYALFDFYDSSSRTFFDIKHSLNDKYLLCHEQVQKRLELIGACSDAVNAKYSFKFLPVKILEINGNEVKFFIREFVNLEDIKSVGEEQKLKLAI